MIRRVSLASVIPGRAPIRILGIAVQAIGSHYKRAERKSFSIKDCDTPCLTVIQRFGGACNLNIHFHSLWIEGVCQELPDGSARFHPAMPPSDADVAAVPARIQARVVRALKKLGLITSMDRDGHAGIEIAAPDEDQDLDLVQLCQGASVLGRIAIESLLSELDSNQIENPTPRRNCQSRYF